ncbi:MAG: two-component regulator propeller domain-containing protein [Melioribacteraceae bacterium]
MKIFFYLVFVNSVLLAQIKSTDFFYQEVATVFTEKNGLAEKNILRINFGENKNVTAFSIDNEYIFDGKNWKQSSFKSKVSEFECKMKLPNYSNAILSCVNFNNSEVIGTNNGLFIKSENDEDWIELFPSDKNYSWKLSNVNVLIVDAKNRLWFGSNEGIGFLENNKWKLFTGKEGLPYKDFTCIAKSENGDIWFGTKKGAIRTDGEKFYYCFSRRWLPDDYINDIKIQNENTVWFATSNGVSKIELKKISLEDKADYFTSQVEERHNRNGFIAQNKLTERYDINSWKYDISDNDGMYTAMYGAAQAFRYAVTKSKEAKKLAKRSFEACKWLVDITHEEGFPARVIIPIDWYEPVNDQYNYEYNTKKQQEDPFWKDILPRFPKSKDGKYLWKCDTSSDELAGHYFFYGIYYDLVAETEAEKEPVREVVTAITDHLIRHGFKLQDHDGKPTRWANFSPEFFNSIWGWDQRGLNSMMMLSFLNVANYITGDSKYLETAKMLREKHHYHINAMQSKMFFPPEDVVPWDNNLCLMSFYGLLNYENDPELILMYRESLENSWMHVSKQKSAFWNTLYASMSLKFNEQVDLGFFKSGKVFPEAGSYSEITSQQYYRTDFNEEDILETLQRLPLDLIGYHMDNRHRLDIQFDFTPGQIVNEGWRPIDPIRTENVFEYAKEHNLKIGWSVVDSKALPIDERCHVRLDRDGFVIDSNEGNGYTENEGTIYLLPYYMARYHKLIN